MHFSEISNKKIIKHDLLNKFHYNNIKDLPELKQVTLNFGCKSFNAQKFATTLLALEILASKKGSITTAKKVGMINQVFFYTHVNTATVRSFSSTTEPSNDIIGMSKVDNSSDSENLGKLTIKQLSK